MYNKILSVQYLIGTLYAMIHTNILYQYYSLSDRSEVNSTEFRLSEHIPVTNKSGTDHF